MQEKARRVRRDQPGSPKMLGIDVSAKGRLHTGGWTRLLENLKGLPLAPMSGPGREAALGGGEGVSRLCRWQPSFAEPNRSLWASAA